MIIASGKSVLVTCIEVKINIKIKKITIKPKKKKREQKLKEEKKNACRDIGTKARV